MDENQERNLKAFQDEMRQINKQIAELERAGQECLGKWLPDYADYLEQYKEYYDDAPLGPRQYYEFVDELE